MSGRDVDPVDRSLDSWLGEQTPAPGEGLRRVVLDEVHRTRQRGGWRRFRGAADEPGRRRWNPTWAVTAVGGVAAVAVLVVGLGPIVDQRPGASARVSPVPSAAFSPVRTIALPGDPAAMGADGGDAIVALRDGTVLRVSGDGTLETLARLGVEPCGVPLSSGGAIYLAGCDARIHRIDGGTGNVTTFEGAGRQLAPGAGGSVWVLDATRRTAVLVDGASGEAVADAALNAFAAGAVAADGRIWIIGEGNARLTVLDPANGNIVGVVDLEHEPTFGLAAPDGLYALSAGAQVIDVVAGGPPPGVNGVVEGLPPLATSAAMGSSGIWVGGSGEVVMLDPVSSSVRQRVPMAGTGWVASSGTNVWALGTDARVLTLLEAAGAPSTP